MTTYILLLLALGGVCMTFAYVFDDNIQIQVPLLMSATGAFVTSFFLALTLPFVF